MFSEGQDCEDTPRKLQYFSRVSPTLSAGSGHFASNSAFERSPSRRLPPVHLSTVGRAELVCWINRELDMNLKDISQASLNCRKLIRKLSLD